MEKVKLTAKQAQEVMKTDGKEWLKNQIFKNIRQAAEHGENRLMWDFENCSDFFFEIKDEFENLGYSIISNSDVCSTVLEITWENDNLETYAGSKQIGEYKMIDRLRKLADVDGAMYLASTAFTLIAQAAMEGKSRISMDISDVSKERVERLIKRLEKEELNVTKDSFGKLLIISF